MVFELIFHDFRPVFTADLAARMTASSFLLSLLFLFLFALGDFLLLLPLRVSSSPPLKDKPGLLEHWPQRQSDSAVASPPQIDIRAPAQMIDSIRPLRPKIANTLAPSAQSANTAARPRRNDIISPAGRKSDSTSAKQPKTPHIIRRLGFRGVLQAVCLMSALWVPVPYCTLVFPFPKKLGDAPFRVVLF